jgi:hypothetical protein
MTLIKNVTDQELTVYNDDNAGAQVAEPGGTIDVPADEVEAYTESGLWAVATPVAPKSQEPSTPASAESTPKEG